MTLRRHISERLLWCFMVAVVCGLVAAGALTNLTLRSIEKNLPNTLLSELNALSGVFEGIAEIVHVAEKAQYRPGPDHLRELREKVDAVYRGVVTLRESYVYDNLVQASAFHAIVAPAIADLQIWVREGVSGFPPEAATTAIVIYQRIQDAYEKARALLRASRANAQEILDVQRARLDRFLGYVNLLFVLTILITLCMLFLLTRQLVLQRKESKAQAALREQSDLMNSLFDSVLLGVVVLSPSGGLLLANRGFTEMTGYTPADVPDLQTWLDRAYPDPAYRRMVTAAWEAATGQGSTIREFRVVCKDGAVKDVEFRGSFLPDGRALVTLSDITDRKRAERMFRESQEMAARSKKMESLGLLAGGVAHDLNNILSGIVSYPELILMDLPEDSKLRKPIQTMQASGERAAAIVLDLLTVARGVATVKAPLNLNRLIRDYLKSPEFEKMAQSHASVRIDTALDPALLNISGSDVHLRKVAMNLVSNAAEAIDGRGSVLIATGNRYIDRPFRGYDDVREGEYAVLSVSDSGPGISTEERERIFEPFYTKKVMGRSGTGLGLAVVWNVVQDHEGYVDVQSGAGGTTFDIYFPATRSVVPADASRRPIADYMGRGETVLVVDDVDAQREIATGMLEKLGYKAVSVPSGEAAVEYCRHHDVDLVVLDMIMDPGINGRETYEALIKITPGQKAVITSGFAESDDVTAAQRLGAGAYIRKPFALETLGTAIRAELDR